MKNLLNIALILMFLVIIVISFFTFTQRYSLYTHQSTYLKYSKSHNQYKISVVADMDVNSKREKDWISILMHGVLKREDDGMYSVSWGDKVTLQGELNEAGRGMELSDLVYFNNMLLTCDDRTGIVYEIRDDNVFPRYILPQGNGDDSKGLKCEWMTVKDDKLYVGSIGKEWTTREGEFIHNQLLWIKTIDEHGRISSVDWVEPFKKIKKALNINDIGYVIHEAVNWDEVGQNWVFLPRRVSVEKYDAKGEEIMGANKVVIFDEQFTQSKVKEIGELRPTYGFSSFKFVPFRHDEILALKSVEHNDIIETYITVFNVNTGKILMEDTYVGNFKYEGIEFS